MKNIPEKNISAKDNKELANIASEWVEQGKERIEQRQRAMLEAFAKNLPEKMEELRNDFYPVVELAKIYKNVSTFHTDMLMIENLIHDLNHAWGDKKDLAQSNSLKKIIVSKILKIARTDKNILYSKYKECLKDHLTSIGKKIPNDEEFYLDYDLSVSYSGNTDPVDLSKILSHPWQHQKY